MAIRRGLSAGEVEDFLGTYAALHGRYRLLRNLAGARHRLNEAANTLEYVFTKRLAHDLLGRVFRHGERILSVGCGDGRLEVGLARRGCTVYGVDKDPTSVGIARGLARRLGVSRTCRFRAVKGTALPFRTGTFDAVLYSHSLHEIDDKLAGLREAHRVLRPGGRAVILEDAPGRKDLRELQEGLRELFTARERRATFPRKPHPGALVAPVFLIRLIRRERAARGTPGNAKLPP